LFRSLLVVGDCRKRADQSMPSRGNHKAQRYLPRSIVPLSTVGSRPSPSCASPRRPGPSLLFCRTSASKLERAENIFGRDVVARVSRRDSSSSRFFWCVCV